MQKHIHVLPVPSPDDDQYIDEMARIFKLIGDPTRMRIISLLAHQEELCVNCIAEGLGMTQSAISHQLRLLREAGLVKFVKEGKEVFYSLDDEHVITLYAQAMDHVKHKTV